jgi:hypothetical protein
MSNIDSSINSTSFFSVASMRRCRRTLILALISISVFAIFSSASFAQSGTVRRVVVIKVDGLPQWFLDNHVGEIDPTTGRSPLPWIERVFYTNGTRINNFYVRGTSISAPSWSMLDTGQHMHVKGNVEFDRYTLQTYDYLNFFPFFFLYAAGQQVDMPGPRLLDEIRVPLMYDAFPYNERYTTYQLFQRGLRWRILQNAPLNHFASLRDPNSAIAEWTIGTEWSDMLFQQLERDVIRKLSDPSVRYLDYYTTDFDHVAHGNRDPRAQLRALQRVDETIGRVWTAISRTPEAPETALVLVSDHGINTDSRSYSQGFNLVRLLTSAAGGGHHVGTKRRLLQNYALRGINPFTPIIVTSAQNESYIRAEARHYPTALLDFDGNERATIHLRDSDLNTLHILLSQLQERRPRNLSPEIRRAAIEHFFATVDRRRADWTRTRDEINEELEVLRRETVRLEGFVAAQPREWSQSDRDAGLDQAARRHAANLRMIQHDAEGYALYSRSLSNLLALDRANFDSSSIRIEDLIPPRVFGESNTIHELQNYVAGLNNGGLRLAPNGTLDAVRSFNRINYFQLLSDQTVRNNVQANLDNHPIDFVAVRLSATSIPDLAPDERADEVVWLYSGEMNQALILSRRDNSGQISIRYLPVRRLTQNEDGRITFERTQFRAGLPLRILEDANFAIPQDARLSWLNNWHTDAEWLRALHRTHYSNGIIGIQELFARHPTEAMNPNAAGLSRDERLIRRFRLRQRLATESDLFVHANDHWNFDVKGFNPGGNHGSFYRASTHSVLMLAGGERTGIPRGLAVDEPYDSLSFVPTLLTLTGDLGRDGQPTPALYERGFRSFPGRLIEELVRPTTAASGAPPVANQRARQTP